MWWLTARTVLVLTLLLMVPLGALASPYLPVFEGGTQPESVLVFTPMGIYLNPATMSLRKGGYLYASYVPVLGYATVARDTMDPATGRPGGAAVFPEVKEGLQTDYFVVSLAQSFGKVTAGLSVFSPYSVRSSLKPGPLRYHLLENDVMNLMVTPAVSLRLHSKFLVGFGVGYVFTRIRRSFMRDLKLRGESPMGEDAPFEAGGQGDEEVSLDVSENSFVFFGGLIWRPRKWLSLGLSYRSKIRALDRTNIQAAGSVSVHRWFEDEGWVTMHGRAKLLTSFPDALTLAALFVLSPKSTLDLSVTWTRWGSLEKERYLFSGTEFGSHGYSNWDVLFARAVRMQDTLEPSVVIHWDMSKDFSLDAGLKFTPPAIRSGWVDAAFVDGYTLSGMIHGTMRVTPSIQLDMGYGLGYTFPHHGGDGYDPYAAVECIESHLDIVWNEGCLKVNDGMALPTASGRYSRIVHQLGVGILYSF